MIQNASPPTKCQAQDTTIHEPFTLTNINEDDGYQLQGGEYHRVRKTRHEERKISNFRPPTGAIPRIPALATEGFESPLDVA